MSPESHAKAIAIAPKFTAALSLIGSAYICYDVLRKPNSNTHSRLLLGMSICDIVVSVAFFCTTWPIPDDESRVYGAIGNSLSCTLQGFAQQCSISVACYNASLTVYYLYYIRFGWTAERIRLRIEPFLHAIALSISLGTAIMGLALNLYNDDISKCWIAPFPRDCRESWKNGGFTNCIRGDNASLYRLVLYYMFVWISIAIVTVNIVLVYLAVLDHEKELEKMEHKDDDTNNREIRHREHSRQVAIQGYWFCGACYLTWVLPTTLRIVQAFKEEAPFPLVISHATILPFQGFFNLLVYVMPQYKHIFQKKAAPCSSAQAMAVYDDSDSERQDSTSWSADNYLRAVKASVIESIAEHGD